jgi:hypothetical protein
VCAKHAVAAHAHATIGSTIVPTSLRLILQFSLIVLTACGSEDPISGGSAGSGSGSGGSPSAAARAQLRFVYRPEWKDRLGTCAWISDYRIKFGANPIAVTAPIEVVADSVSEYFEVDGRPYQDSDVLHICTCSKTQTSKQTLQVYGRFGLDLPLEPGKRYTLTLAGTGATLEQDP